MRFSFIGMQRSGNHAVIEWFLSHFDSYLFRNNILMKTYSGMESQVIRYNYDEKNLPQCIVESWENFAAEEIEIHPDSYPIVLILRDPWNWWASWFRFHIPNPNVHNIQRVNTIPMYISHANFARKYPEQTILFNKWFADVNYRREIESRYGLKENDSTINTVSKFGSGSTFDSLNMDGKAQNMKVLERYKKVLHLRDYVVPLRRFPELCDISKELFNMEPVI